MQTVVGFEGLEVRCIIGILPQERVQEQSLYFDLRLEADLTGCISKDTMEGTLDYTTLASIVQETAQTAQCLTIEHLAQQIARALFAWAPLSVEQLHLKIRKPAAIPEAVAAFTELSLSADECANQEIPVCPGC